jgi:hypothetical protein
MRRVPPVVLVVLGAALSAGPARAGTGGAGGMGGAGGAGGAGGVSSGVGGAGTCIDDGLCMASEGCDCPDCLMAARCHPGQCVTDGVCNDEDSCTCPDCTTDPYCSDPAHCTDAAVCDTFTEGCECANCRTRPECPQASGAASSSSGSAPGTEAGHGGCALETMPAEGPAAAVLVALATTALTASRARRRTAPRRAGAASPSPPGTR